MIDDVRKCVTMDLKKPGSTIYLVEPRGTRCKTASRVHRALANAIARRLVLSCHDVSDGGVAVAAAEMCIASGLGMIMSEAFHQLSDVFEESPTRYLIEADNNEVVDALTRAAQS